VAKVLEASGGRPRVLDARDDIVTVLRLRVERRGAGQLLAGQQVHEVDDHRGSADVNACAETVRAS
jgi:hypothetical protein